MDLKIVKLSIDFKFVTNVNNNLHLYTIINKFF